MPFPVLSRTDFSPTGATLPVDTYFNPLVNTEWYTRRPSRVLNGYITGTDYLTLFKNLTTPESMDDIAKIAQPFFGCPINVATLLVSKTIQDLLPDDCKWMSWFTYNSNYRDNGDYTYTYRVRFRYPVGLVYSDLQWDTIETNIIVSYDRTTSVYSIKPAAIEAFKTKMAELRVIQKLQTKFDAIISSDSINCKDGGTPQFPLFVYRWASGVSVFYPVNFTSDIVTPVDWADAARIVELLAPGAGYVVTLRLSANQQRLEYTVKLAGGSRRAIERVLSYSTNIFDYLPFTIKGPKEHKAPLYGVELEACGDYSPKELIDAQKDLFFIMKQDGSIYGSKPNKYELVTVPASLKAHKRLWAEFFEKVDYNKFDTSKDTGNGMHVHIDRKSFTPGHLNRFTWFIINPAHEDFLLAVSERPNKNNLNEWASRPSVLSEPTRLSAASKATVRNHGVRGAVHYKGNKTVEVRLFKGIVSYATVVKNLEFVDSVFEYTRVATLSQLSLKGYLDWLGTTQVNKYQMLKTFYTEVKAPEHVLAAQLSDYLWNKSFDFDVATLLNKAPFKVTNQHITVLNKRRRKRSFILKDGQVICIQNNGGILAKLDKSQQQKQTRGAVTLSLTEFAA